MGSMTLAGWSEEFVGRLYDRLAPLAIERSDVHVVLRIEAALPETDETSLGATKVQSQGEMTYYASDHSFDIVTSRGGVLHTDCENQTVVAHVTASLLSDPDLLDDLLLTAVAPILRRRGFFPLHAFACVWHGLGVLLVGNSGSGKTTAGLALVRSGWRFLSDDGPFLRRRDAHVDIVACHDPLNVTPRTALFFPELRPFLGDARGGPKHRLLIDRLYGDVLAESAPATLVLLPRVGHREDSTVARLSAAAALAEMVGRSLDAWDKGTMAANFALLSSVAEDVPAYRLTLGHDFDHLPDLIAGLLPKQ